MSASDTDRALEAEREIDSLVARVQLAAGHVGILSRHFEDEAYNIVTNPSNAETGEIARCVDVQTAALAALGALARDCSESADQLETVIRADRRARDGDA